jgi:hypothetical protein
VENKKKNKRRSRTGCDKKESGVCTNDHPLSRFKSQYEAVCDGCGESRPPASELHGCRICNFDLCSQCHGSQIIKANEEAAALVGGNKSATTNVSTDASVKETNADMMCDDVTNDEAHAMQDDGDESTTTTTTAAAAAGSSCSSVVNREEEQDGGKVTPTSNEEGDDGTVSSADKAADNDDPSEPIMLVDCLQRFTAPEVLSDNGFACDGCLGEKRPASKQLTLSKLPNTLVVNVTTYNIVYNICLHA